MILGFYIHNNIKNLFSVEINDMIAQLIFLSCYSKIRKYIDFLLDKKKDKKYNQ